MEARTSTMPEQTHSAAFTKLRLRRRLQNPAAKLLLQVCVRSMRQPAGDRPSGDRGQCAIGALN
jgi:hypothetical protein